MIAVTCVSHLGGENFQCTVIQDVIDPLPQSHETDLPSPGVRIRRELGQCVREADRFEPLNGATIVSFIEVAQNHGGKIWAERSRVRANLFLSYLRRREVADDI